MHGRFKYLTWDDCVGACEWDAYKSRRELSGVCAIIIWFKSRDLFFVLFPSASSHVSTLSLAPDRQQHDEGTPIFSFHIRKLKFVRNFTTLSSISCIRVLHHARKSYYRERVEPDDPRAPGAVLLYLYTLFLVEERYQESPPHQTPNQLDPAVLLVSPKSPGVIRQHPGVRARNE